MSDGTKKTSLKSWYKGLQSEFKKISWPDRDTLTRETATVTVVAIVLGVIIATLDMILQYGISFLV
ncbi:MAG: preprotein translocase subunit SecE [Eubacterium sp.]|nr:preprotein translocase subunit SecE [Eubacterium sp.]